MTLSLSLFFIFLFLILNDLHELELYLTSIIFLVFNLYEQEHDKDKTVIYLFILNCFMIFEMKQQEVNQARGYIQIGL